MPEHAGRDASVTLSLRSADNELQFSVRDTGRGFDPQKTTRGTGACLRTPLAARASQDQRARTAVAGLVIPIG